MHQLCGRTIYLKIALELREEQIPEGKCYIRFATPDEVYEFFQKMGKENPRSRYELLRRKRFYDRGFRRVIIAWTADTHEMCNIRWLITAQDMRGTGFEDRLPQLREAEAGIENAFTLERFRGRGVQTVSGLQASEMARTLGYKRTVGLITEDNTASLKSSKKRGALMFERIRERHLFFSIRRTTLERFDPPVPIPIPGESGGPGV